jgi:hypothetical protein
MTDQSQISQAPVGMGKKMARRIEYGIIGLCLVALMLIFQPFAKIGFSIGCVLVVVGGLAFNLVPMCQPEKSLRALFKSGIIVLVIFAVVVCFALSSAVLYGVYLRS